MLDDIIENVQTLTFELSSHLLFTEGIEAAVRELCEQVLLKNNMNFEFMSIGNPLKINENERIILYQAIRELLYNIVKHANAKNVEITYSYNQNIISVVIEDDGKGFSKSVLNWQPSNKGGFGLFSIKERIDHLGGDMDLESEINQGTRITIHVPLKSLN